MKKVTIIHGSYGHPNENWFPWLKKELEQIGYQVFVPKFPTPKNQNLDTWMEIFKDYEKNLNDDAILIGHSLGSAFILNILEKMDGEVKACFFVSGFIGLLNNEFDKINKTFTDKKFSWDKIKNNCRNFFIYHSDNDPYVPLKKAEELTEVLDGRLKIIKNAGHFNEKFGYDEFKILLEDIQTLK